MPEFSVIDGKPYHVGAILRQIRTEHGHALALMGVNAHREMRRTFSESSFCRALLIDGKLAALGGVTGTLASDRGHIWLALSNAATRFPKYILREARKQIREILETRSELYTSILNRDVPSQNFARHLGFEYAPEKTDRPGTSSFRLAPRIEPPIEAAPFIIFAPPRSRTYWLSKFLTYGDCVCGHDEIAHVRGLDDVKSYLNQELFGTVETGAAPYWRLLKSIKPDTRVVVVRRNVDDVVKSLMATGVEFDRAALTQNMRRLDRKLEQIARRFPGAISVQFDELEQEKVCAKIFEHCLPYKHDRAWWASLAETHIEKNLKAAYRGYIAHMPQLLRASSICAQEIRSSLWRQKRKIPLDGMTIQEERFEPAWRDAEPLLAQHCVDVGEPAEQFSRKNIDLMRKLDNLGMMQVVTARSNGRMFGYLVTVLGPSLEDETLRVATQSTFYASSDAPGLGARLQKVSADLIRARGGDWDIMQRAGVRGAGSRLGSLYRRMGAQENGQLYKISIRGS